ncbi:hypothetical protein SLS55_000090 [Diplodia seriata]|uniref:CCHC-type domain-containing protein n=1 Tax=Diplodia seriata TaxID=420778 RepID=A0ABR3CVT8_9PEZI
MNEKDAAEFLKEINESSAFDRLFRLRQTYKPFADFISAFRKNAAEAAITDQKTLRYMLLQRLSIELIRYLDTVYEKDRLSFEQLVDRLQKHDKDQRANTQAEKDQRREKNLCYQCGEPGHIAFRCPAKPIRRC